MSLRKALGYRLSHPLRFYGRLFNWRKRDSIPPSCSMVVAQATDGTAKKVTYAITATSNLQDGVISYSVDFGDASGVATTATGSRTYAAGGLKTITATVTDSAGGVTILTGSAIADVAATDITLTVASFSHLAVAGTAIGTLGSTDVDVTDTYTYTLVSGSGSTNNASFAIVGASLNVGAAPVAAGSYSVRVRSTDENNVIFEKAITLTST